MKNLCILLFCLMGTVAVISAQDSVTYRLRLDVPLFEYPENIHIPYHYPSMKQALKYSLDFYELGYFGIDVMGDAVFGIKNRPESGLRNLANSAFKYALGLGFAKYGSELPIPLGVWGHEEFHRSVLGVKGLSSENGNWIFGRWDGTVYGLTDESLDDLKSNDLNQLLYAYVAGVQYEILLSQEVTLQDFYFKRSLYKNSLLLYNAWYVYDYFRFSAGNFSDSVKIKAPPHEDVNPAQRDFAGADLTSWVYDMFSPAIPFTSRDSFPGGEGVNRRVGFSDLSPEGQEFLKDQKKLSLLNFLNPAIFFINRIRVSRNFAFNLFAQYAPTHFGNATAVYLPLQYRNYDLLVHVGRFSSHDLKGVGAGIGIFSYPLGQKFDSDLQFRYWNQPESFMNDGKINGGSFHMKIRYHVKQNVSAYLVLHGKTMGWEPGDPYLDKNLSVQIGAQAGL